MEALQDKESKGELHQAYKLLAIQKEAVKDFIDANKVELNGKHYVRRDLYKDIPIELLDGMNKAARDIKAADKILTEDVISFMQNFTYEGTDSDKGTLFRVFFDLLYSQGGRKTINTVEYKEISLWMFLLLTASRSCKF